MEESLKKVVEARTCLLLVCLLRYIPFKFSVLKDEKLPSLARENLIDFFSKVNFTFRFPSEIKINY